MAFEFDKMAAAVKAKAEEAANAAGAAAANVGDTLTKTATDAHRAASDNIPGFAEGSEALGYVAESAFAVAQTAAEDAKQKIDELKDDGADEYEAAVVAYNTAYTDMNDRGVMLHKQRERAVDIISFSEKLVSSIANKPKTFEVSFEEVEVLRKEFTGAEEYATRELMEARTSAGAGGAGLAAGAAVASLAPSAAMWIATTFGTASTGAAISTLSGAAATNAALAWLGGGTLAAGGAGAAGGTALLALSGPVGWSIAGASLLASIALFTKKRIQTREEKNGELLAVKANTEQLREMDAKIGALLDQTTSLRDALNESFVKSMRLAESDYNSLSDDEKMILGSLVNNTMSLASLLNTKIAEISDKKQAAVFDINPEDSAAIATKSSTQPADPNAESGDE